MQEQLDCLVGNWELLYDQIIIGSIALPKSIDLLFKPAFVKL
jgi:hypothetical protein